MTFITYALTKLNTLSLKKLLKNFKKISLGYKVSLQVIRYMGMRRSARKIIDIFAKQGWRGLRDKLIFLVGTVNKSVSNNAVYNNYAKWIDCYDTLDDTKRSIIRDQLKQMQFSPLISIIMPVYNPALEFLNAAIISVKNQLYSNWELCIADDASTDQAVRDLLAKYAAEDQRIKVVYRTGNGHISQASNSALALSIGEFVALLDHDDMLAEHALFQVAITINEYPDVGLIYSDEDKIDQAGKRYDPYFKCEFNYELLLAQNMISHLGVYRRNLLEKLGGFRSGFEGAQDYDLVLRVVEQLDINQIKHLPYILYHWRAIPGSTALNANEKDYTAEKSRKALTEHLLRTNKAGVVLSAPDVPNFNRVQFAPPTPLPLVSILILTRDRADLLKLCIDSILQRSTYTNYEIIIIDNGSVEEVTFSLFEQLPKNQICIIRNDSPFNFSALNNYAARQAKGDYLCLMNNDIEVIATDWLEEMISFASQPGIGCVGARLWYPDERLQHGGVILGCRGVAGHAFYQSPRGDMGYFSRALLHQSFSVVTAACLVVRRAIFEQVDGMNESLAVAFNDVDFCLRVREAGYRNVWTPYAELYHHESASRGYEDTPEKQARFAKEVDILQKRWQEKLLCDPAYSPNLTLDRQDFSYAWPPRVKQIGVS